MSDNAASDASRDDEPAFSEPTQARSTDIHGGD
jgi:hypothetical protein